MTRYLLALLLLLTPSLVHAQTTVWNSWEVSTANPVNLDFYESTNLGVTKGTPQATFHMNAHPQSFNNVDQWWAAGTNEFPYIGKSTVPRGMDAGETNAPLPLGVLDLQVHPPNAAHYTVVAFVAPTQGNYTVSNLAVRRVSSMGTTGAILRLYDNQQQLVASLTATQNRAWVAAQQSYIVYNVPAGQSLYFAVDRSSDYGWDATEIAWTITLEAVAPPPPPPPPPATPSCNEPTPAAPVVNPRIISFIASPDHARVSSYVVGVFAEGVAASDTSALTKRTVLVSDLLPGLEPGCFYVSFSSLLLAVPVAIVHRTAVETVLNDQTSPSWSELSGQFERILPSAPSGVQLQP